MSRFPFRFPALEEYTAQAEFPHVRYLHQQQNFIDCTSFTKLTWRKNVLQRMGEWPLFHPGNCSINWNDYSQETGFLLTSVFPLPPIRAQPFGRCSLAEMGVHTKLASRESGRGIASYSQSSTSLPPPENMAVSPRYHAETFTGTLTYKCFLGHRYRNVSLDFFKTCFTSISTELIHFWNQIYLKL